MLAEASEAQAALSEIDEAQSAARREAAEVEERRAAAAQSEGEVADRLAALEERAAALSEEIEALDAQRVTAAERLASIQAQEVAAQEEPAEAVAETRPDAEGGAGRSPDTVRAALAGAPGLERASPDEVNRLEARLSEGVCATEALTEVFGRPNRQTLLSLIQSLGPC